MTLESKIRVIAGSLVLISLALGYWVSPWFFLFTAFVGFNLLQSGLTGWCLMNDILRKTGLHKDAPAAG
ncbi:MAG: DUF2892 domain-containing protein [Gemmatimonadetes bacterium]|nr:DUF2892 domain-containing protein [Gemmatimonadota bacterium]